MNLPKSLREKRDVGAEYLLASDAGKGLRHCYRIGYDQGVADHAELVKVLLKALTSFTELETLIAPDGRRWPFAAVASEALTAYREAMETGGM